MELRLAKGNYPGHHEIKGAPFRISFWTMATDITAADAREREAFARELVSMFNNGPKMLALLEELIEIEGPMGQPGTGAWASKVRELIAEVRK